MLRIISGLILLIISQISFASISTSTETIPATASAPYQPYLISYSSEVSGNISGTHSLSYYYSTPLTLTVSGKSCLATWSELMAGCWTSDGSRHPTAQISIYGTSAVDYTCPSGYTLSGTNCTKDVSVDSCASFKGQKFYAYTLADTTDSVCEGTCGASFGAASFGPTDVYQEASYIYTGTTDGCTTDTPTVDAATAQAANLRAKIQKAIDDAIAACGGAGHYTTGTFNGNTVISCKESTAQSTANNSTTTSTTTNSDNSTTTTTTTTTNNSTTTNNNTTTTVNSDGSTTTTGGSSSGGSSSGGSSGGTSGGSTAGTSGTTTTTTTTNPDGSTTSTTSSASSTVLPGTDASYDYQDTDRNDWSSRNFQSVIESNLEKLKGTALYGSITGFFTVSFNGSCSASDFNTTYQGAELSASFDWCARLLPFQVYIKAIVLFLCSFYAFRRAIE